MTRVLKVDRVYPDMDIIRQAADVLRRGGLVAFATDTVYGLGALALDADAVQSVYDAKGRPPNSPLIVHVTGAGQARRYAKSWPQSAERLAALFWPGPLSLVVESAACMPAQVTGGSNTVAVRAPNHPVAIALIGALGDGIAAPSANRYLGLPPVRAEHVLEELGGLVELVLDSGVCDGGIESTVVDVTGATAKVLRRGAVGLDRLAEVVPAVDTSQVANERGCTAVSWLRVVSSSELVAACTAPQFSVGIVLCGSSHTNVPAGGRIVPVVLPGNALEYGHRLYDALHELKGAGCKAVFVERVPEDASWAPICDRLARLGKYRP